METSTPTTNTYAGLDLAYGYFNKHLFYGTLPACVITMQRHKGARGYFSGERFMNAQNETEIRDEIALNPQYFATRSLKEVLSTLAHEMVHLWQQHYGDPPRTCYHDKQWAKKMTEIGLIPSHNGQPGGKQTGQNMTHYIEQGGSFDRVCDQFLMLHSTILYHDRAGADSAGAAARAKKAASKTKYTCSGCDLNVWGKPDLNIICGDCGVQLAAPDSSEDEN